MDKEFPASGFDGLARLLESEGEVFQNHVLELVRDVVADRALHRRIMSLLRNSLPPQEVSDFLLSLPTSRDYLAQSTFLEQFMTLMESLKSGGHASSADIAELIAAELIHRKLWEKALRENPGTLPALKQRLVL